jgi:hypothetical protein
MPGNRSLKKQRIYKNKPRPIILYCNTNFGLLNKQHLTKTLYHMKNAVITGLVIGILSGLWLFVMHWMGYNTTGAHQISPYEYFSILIPFVGLYFGVRAYRANEMNGVISFLEALVQCFKTLIVGGVVAVFAAIVYLNYVAGGVNYTDFSGRMFGALLVGILSALAVSLMLMNKSKAI